MLLTATFWNVTTTERNTAAASGAPWRRPSAVYRASADGKFSLVLNVCWKASSTAAGTRYAGRRKSDNMPLSDANFSAGHPFLPASRCSSAAVAAASYLHRCHPIASRSVHTQATAAARKHTVPGHVQQVRCAGIYDSAGAMDTSVKYACRAVHAWYNRRVQIQRRKKLSVRRK